MSSLYPKLRHSMQDVIKQRKAVDKANIIYFFKHLNALIDEENCYIASLMISQI